MFWRKGREKYKQKYQNLENNSFIKQSNCNLESETKEQNDEAYSINSNSIILINNKSPIRNSYSKKNLAKKKIINLEYFRFKNKRDTIMKFKESNLLNQISNIEYFERDKPISLNQKYKNNKNINEYNLNNKQNLITNNKNKYISITKLLPNNYNINSNIEMKKNIIKSEKDINKKNSIQKFEGNKVDLTKLKNKKNFVFEYKQIDFKNFFKKENIQSVSNLLNRKLKKNGIFLSIKNQSQLKNKSFIKCNKNNCYKYIKLSKNRDYDKDGGIIDLSKIKKENYFDMNVIKIQKFIKGYLLRKSFLHLIKYIIYYKGFCDIIQNILNFKIKKYVFNKLFMKKNIKDILIEMLKNEKYVLQRWVIIWKQISQMKKKKTIIKRLFYIYEKNDLKNGKIKGKFMNLWLRKVMKIKLNENSCLKEIDDKNYKQIQQKNLLNNDINFKEGKKEMNNKGIRILIMQKKFQQYSLKSLILKTIKDTKRNIFNLWKRNGIKMFDNSINKDEINESEELKNKKIKGQLKILTIIEKYNKSKNENIKLNDLEKNETKKKIMETDSDKINKSKTLIKIINSVISKIYKTKLINRLIWITRIKTLKILIRNISIYYEDSNLFHYFNLWREKSSFEMLKKTKKIQKYYKYYLGIKKKNEKYYMSNLLKNILQKKQKREELNLLSGLKRWKKNYILSSLAEPCNKITHKIKNYLLKKKNFFPKYEIEQIFSEEIKPLNNKINKDNYYKNENELNEKERNNKIINKLQFINSETGNSENKLPNNKLFINNFTTQIIDIKNEQFLNTMTLFHSYFENLNENYSKQNKENNSEFENFIFNKENIRKLKNKNYKINSYCFELNGNFENKKFSK